MQDYIQFPFTDINIKKIYDHHGFWLVDKNKAFKNKNTALAYCSKNKTKDIKFCLYDDVFENVPWHVEPDISLIDLYKMRAQQIRDTYDYVVLTFSGGSDSTNILHSFIENNIVPDEVISYMCIGKDFTNENVKLNQEIEYNKQIIKKYVLDRNIPYHTIDVSNYYDTIFDDPNWIFSMANNRAYINARIHGSRIDRFRRLVASGKKCCVVYGLEKPNVILKNNNFYSYFIDNPLQQYTNNEMYNHNYDGLHMERFYVTGDMPELTIKQSHVVANYYQHKIDDRLKEQISGGFESKFLNYKETCIELLYSHCFDQKQCFTIGKNPLIWGYRDDWVLSLPDHEKKKKNIIAGWNFLKEKLGAEQFNRENWIYDTLGCVGKMHNLNKKYN